MFPGEAPSTALPSLAPVPGLLCACGPLPILPKIGLLKFNFAMLCDPQAPLYPVTGLQVMNEMSVGMGRPERSQL